MSTVPAPVVTGDDSPTDINVIDYVVGRYNVKVVLSHDNRFLGIAEVAVRSDFRSYEQRSALQGFHDVEEFYPE